MNNTPGLHLSVHPDVDPLLVATDPKQNPNEYLNNPLFNQRQYYRMADYPPPNGNWRTSKPLDWSRVPSQTGIRPNKHSDNPSLGGWTAPW